MKALISVILLSSGFHLYAQKGSGKVSLYVFDENWKGCRPEDAKHLLHREKLSDTTNELRYYNCFKILRSVEYSLDEEAIRIIKNSPKWRSAHQDGRLVKAYRRQPLTFQVPR